MIAKEIEKEGIPVAHITAMSMLSKQVGASRTVTGVKIPHPCGDPTLSPEGDRELRREIVKCAISALQTDVSVSTNFVPNAVATFD